MADGAPGSGLGEPLLHASGDDNSDGAEAAVNDHEHMTELYKEAMITKMGGPLASYTFKLGPFDVPLPFGGALLAFFAYSALLYNFANQLFSVYNKVRNSPGLNSALLSSAWAQHRAHSRRPRPG